MEDAAGILFKRGVARMFALCKRYVPMEAIEILPAGKYLCADCAAQDRDGTMERLLHMAKTQWGARPEFCVAMVLVSGVLQWKYQVQVYIGP